jgi:hypothetical protein
MPCLRMILISASCRGLGVALGFMPSTLAGALGGKASDGIQDTIRRIYTIQVFGYFGAQEPARYRVLRVPLDSCGATIFYRYQHSTSIRAIVGAGGMNNFLHDQRLYNVP